MSGMVCLEAGVSLEIWTLLEGYQGAAWKYRSPYDQQGTPSSHTGREAVGG